MKRITCSACGSNRFAEKGGYRICLYCDSKYPIYSDLNTTVQSGINLNDDVSRLLQKCYDDPLHARKYANLILDIDPTNREALKFL